MGVPRVLTAFFFLMMAAAAWMLFPSARELGRVHAAAGRHEAALSWLEVQWLADPADRTNGVRFLAATDALYLDDRFKAAADQMEAMFGHDPNFLNIRIQHERGRMRRDETKRLLWKLHLAAGTKQERIEAFESLLEMLRSDGDLRRSEKLMRAELARRMSPDLFDDLAAVQKRLGRPFAALQTYRRWASAEPGRTEPLMEQARILDGIGRPERALEVLQRADKVKPGDRQILFATYDLLVRQKNWETADRMAQNYLRMHPEDPEAWAASARVLQQLGDPKRTAEAAERWYALDPLDPDAAVMLAEVRIRSGNTEEAALILAQVHGAGEGDHRTHHLLGDLLAAAGRRENARQEYQTALGLLRSIL